MPLSEIIKQKIREEGPLSFRDFMEMSLYYPELGYYTSPEYKIGQEGDYYTCPVLTSLFGEMIGKQLEEMWSVLGKKEFTIVEYGAGTGALCADILQYLKNNQELYAQLRYCIVEKSAALRSRQNMILSEKVSWYNSIQDIPEIIGCILSNEVVDNFSVHQVVMEVELMEVFVDYNNDFIEILKPASAELKNYLHQQNVVLPKGYRTEINLEAIEWIQEIAAALLKGFVLTIDYGYLSSEFYREHRRMGTLNCFYKHSVNSNPYNNVGKQDITTHVNFSVLHHWGAKSGLEFGCLSNQTAFLRALGLVSHLRKMEESGKEMNPLKTHALLNMGNKFKVMVQQKGVKSQMLSGMMFGEKIF
jgi:SAM-dependent MidA family methyltransferase